MNTADIITSFFNNELTAEQERQFLLSVAASDSMRLGLKSHVMLDKILADNASDLHISDSVRSTIFAEAEAVLASNGTSTSGGANILRGGRGGGSWWQTMRGAFSAKMAAGGMAVALAGFGLGYATHSQFADLSVASSPVQSIVPVPTTLRDQSAAVPAPSSTISVPVASATEAQQANHSAEHSVAVAHRAARKPVLKSVAKSVSVDSQTPSNPAVFPEVNALRQQEEFLKSGLTADSITPQSSVTNYDHSSNPIPPAQVRAKHSKPNRDSSNQKPQGSTTTP